MLGDDKHHAQYAWTWVLAFLTTFQNTSSLPSTAAVGYYDEWRGEAEIGQNRPPMVRFGVTGPPTRTNGLISDSIQDALRMFLLPIKNDDPQLDFYTMYKQETMEYDTENMKNHNEDLNITLIFVRACIPLVATFVDHNFRLVCSPRSALPSSSTSSPSSSQTLANGQKPTSEQSSSASTDPFLQTKILPLPRSGAALPRISSRPQNSYTQAC